MSLPLLIRPEAEGDLDDARQWYERRQPGLGRKFLLGAWELIARISQNPELFPTVHSDMRRASLDRFPYGVIYRTVGNRVVILGVVHDRRDPKSWKYRQ